MKIWDKGSELNELIERFTIGKDRELDMYLARYDILGSLAHIRMLNQVGLLSKADLDKLQEGLKDIYHLVESGEFRIEEGIEDVHSEVEHLLTRELGEAGKRIHSGRSRNDQVLLDLKLFIREEIRKISERITELFDLLIEKSEQYKAVLMPGYTHLQVAMPSSFGLWFGAYAESLVDDLLMFQTAFKVANQNPLGSAAGYGSSFPLNRKMTTELLGFEDLAYNVIYAQMGRGKTEKIASFAMSSLAGTLSKLAMDVCLFMSQNFGFVSLPEAFTTGSSIMPHKKNPDVFELLRAKCNKIQALPGELSLLVNNMPSGYFRDLQMLKESFLPSFETLIDCLDITILSVKNLTINEKILEDEKYKYIFSVEEVNKKVLEGKAFRDAYQEVGKDIANNTFHPDKNIQHKHEGSIGNLCNQEIKNKYYSALQQFPFKQVEEKLNELLAD